MAERQEGFRIASRACGGTRHIAQYDENSIFKFAYLNLLFWSSSTASL